MHLKHNILSTTLLLLIGCQYLVPSHGFCSLEKMKKFAMEACEHLFLQDEGREKRSLSYEHNLVDDSAVADFRYERNYDSKRHLISRSIYPRGGYLKVDREFFHKLSEVDVLPRYKPKKLHHDKREHERERFKRDHSISYNNIPYCCYNRCEEDFFC